MTGYSKLAAFMSDKRHTILRKYENLAVQDLLFQQAELCQLEFEYGLVAKKSGSQEDSRQYYNRHWLFLKSSEDQDASDQLALAMLIREKLHQYHSSMLQYSQVADMSVPKDSQRNMLHSWIRSPSLGGGCDFVGRDLGGQIQPSVYDKMYQNDLAILNSTVQGEDDFFTRFLLGPILSIFHRVWKHKKAPLPVDPGNPASENNETALHHYDDTHVREIVDLLGTAASSVTPMISIVALSFVHTFAARLGLVCCFTFVFALSLAMATRARRIEIFAATAAFASVQVVFVGSSNFSS